MPIGVIISGRKKTTRKKARPRIGWAHSTASPRPIRNCTRAADEDVEQGHAEGAELAAAEQRRGEQQGEAEQHGGGDHPADQAEDPDRAAQVADQPPDEQRADGDRDRPAQRADRRRRCRGNGTARSRTAASRSCARPTKRDVVAAGPQAHPRQGQDRRGDQRKDREHQDHQHGRQDEQRPCVMVEPLAEPRAAGRRERLRPEPWAPAVARRSRRRERSPIRRPVSGAGQLVMPSEALYSSSCSSRPNSSVISSQPSWTFCSASSAVISPAR